MSAGSFFEFRDRLQSRSTAPQVQAPAAITVSELTARIDRVLRGGFPNGVWVKGEVSNFRPHAATGHWYFTLKDNNACLPCVMFQSESSRVRFRPGDGMELLATGQIRVYIAQGKYQLYVNTLQPIGQGALELAFQQLKSKLAAEGLFAADRKKTLPIFPRRIGIVTSTATAALQDILKVLGRYPWLRLFVYHVPVQGDGSAEKIAAAIDHLNAHQSHIALDVLLLARGGGSLEDLWEFNEEIVARAIARSTIPIVTGIGHEVDISIADMVADHHAHTPTEAAQTIVQAWKSARDQLNQIAGRMRRGVHGALERGRRALESVERHEMFRRPMHRINQLSQLLDDRQRVMTIAMGERLRRRQNQLHQLAARLDRHRPELLLNRFRQRVDVLARSLEDHLRSRLQRAETRLQKITLRLGQSHPRHQVRLEGQRLASFETALQRAATGAIKLHQQRLAALQAQLEALNPENVLRRGYSLTTIKRTGAILRTASQVKPGDRLVSRLADGQIESTVEDARQLPLFE